MNNLIKVPITDKLGRQSHRWVKEDASSTSQSRLQTISAPSSSLPQPLMLAGSPVPETTQEVLYHVGTFDSGHKKAQSLEGGGLSVSRDPLKWRSIAYLTGDVWKLDVSDNRFLDYHELTDDQRRAINDYGVERGYLVPTTVYKVSYWDDEDEDTAYMLMTDLAEAEEEQEGIEGSELETLDSYVASDSFPDSTVLEGSTQYEQIMAAVWVSEVATDLDGVWWEDSYNEYSAPRGVLSMSKISEWIDSASNVADADVIEED